jgi:CRISPR-associated endoribonuclease Cas2
MLLISYDIANDKVRAKFSRFLAKFGFRLQYSVFKVRNSESFLKKLQFEIDNTFGRQFTESDSVLVFSFSDDSIIAKYGYAKHDDSNMVVCV